MPGIYERDNINYGGMLGNAMAAKANYLENRYGRVADIGRTWGGAVSNSGKALQNVLNQYAQQQYQAEQNALNREDALNRAREQQAWQAEQNRLQRDSTERIAGLNRGAAIEQQKAEKQAQSAMHYEISKGALESIADEIMRTDDPARLAQLYRQRDEQRAKMEYYAGGLPEGYPGRQDPFKGYAGFTRGMGKDGNEAQPQTPSVPAGDSAGSTPPPVETTANTMSGLITDAKNVKGSKEIEGIIGKLNGLDTRKLTDQQRSQVKSTISELNTKLAEAKKAEANEAAYQAELKAAGNNAAKRALVKKKYGRK